MSDEKNWMDWLLQAVGAASAVVLYIEGRFRMVANKHTDLKVRVTRLETSVVSSEQIRNMISEEHREIRESQKATNEKLDRLIERELANQSSRG